jgi:hypothetical protein
MKQVSPLYWFGLCDCGAGAGVGAGGGRPLPPGGPGV